MCNERKNRFVILDICNSQRPFPNLVLIKRLCYVFTVQQLKHIEKINKFSGTSSKYLLSRNPRVSPILIILYSLQFCYCQLFNIDINIYLEVIQQVYQARNDNRRFYISIYVVQNVYLHVVYSAWIPGPEPPSLSSCCLAAASSCSHGVPAACQRS